jgi:hypothetical protein
MLKTVNDKVYKLVQGPGEFKRGGCCVADYSRDLCARLPCSISTIWAPAPDQADLKD